jgi:uncharacterized membrane protein
MGTSFTLDSPVTDRSAQGRALPEGNALAPELRPRTPLARDDQRIADARRGTGGETLADFLGFFSIGLGLAETLAPGAVARAIGVDPRSDRVRNTLRLMGMREITSGLGILSKQQPATWVWSRVAGDALDLGLLATAMTNPENKRGRTMFGIASVLGVTALDVMNARQLAQQERTASHEARDEGMIEQRRAITIARPVAEVYGFWRNFEQLPQFMRHLERVTMLDERRSHWVAKAPAGASIEWDAETTEDLPNERISWRSLPGSQVHNAGTVEFREAPRGLGTEVRVRIEYKPPFGKLGAKVAKLFREEPGAQMYDDLRHFKQVMELGEIVLSDASKQRGMHPAQPNTEPVEL